MDVPAPRDSADSQTADAKPAPAKLHDHRVTLPPLDYAFQALLRPVKKSLARIEARLETTSAAPASPAATPATENTESKPVPAALQPVAAAADATLTDGDPLATLHCRFDQLSTELADFRREAIALIERHASDVAPVTVPDVVATQPVPAAVVADPRGGEALTHESWAEIILGSELCADSSLNAIRGQFLDDVVSGGVSARALAGQLLLLQATAADELPERFRHVGEAYYRWRPRLSTADEPLERSLADWLTRRAEAAGLRNSIQLVRPGDRFDSTRHSATTRGIEVVAVHGWIVLRDRQKVYTKANVTVR
jgi:hypothetical protein